ncbi:MAG: hypothetical protein WC340_17365 [Kiritimatiellia bacterium]|jgi:membrane protein YdbS with pleckstrin-like domain|uniref:Membrane protein YdbS with pleckstrin-like domain n=1 Tax=Oligosphaera ethanolica TaxID=760260 RepID=A0AAE4AP14_9BACT|nr:membrane protein YdbS with pleckstrin-like domain [Oligosphaera ethanolica]
MKIVIVGERNGKAVVRWPQFLVLALVLSLVIGIGIGAVFYLLAGQWSHISTLVGIVIGAGIAGLGLIQGLRTAPGKQPPL